MASCSDAVCEQLIGWSFPPVLRAIDGANWHEEQFADRVYCGRCGDSVGPGEATAQGCARCGIGAELEGGIGDAFVRLGMYANPLRGWVRAIKYGGWAEMATHLGELLGRQILAADLVDRSNAVVVSMPMPWLRRFFRGIDHAHLISQGLASVIDAPVVKALARGGSAPQVSLTPSERRRAGARRMFVRRRMGGWSLQGVDMVLADDVRTTGASMLAAVRMLRTLKPRRVICAAVAVSDTNARRTRAAERFQANH